MRIVLQTNFSSTNSSRWYCASWHPYATNKYGDKDIAYRKMKSALSNLSTSDYSSSDYSTGYRTGEFGSSAYGDTSFELRDSRRVDVGLVPEVLALSTENDIENFRDSGTVRRTPAEYPDLSEVQIAIHNSPPEWVNLFEFLKGTPLLQAEIKPSGESTMRFLWVIGLCALGIIILGAARGISSGLEIGLQDLIVRNIRKDDSGEDNTE